MENKIKIKNEEIEQLLGKEAIAFPKYTTQIMNLANSNAQGTRPKVVGQMSDLIEEFDGEDLSDWEKWYKNRKPAAINDATDKVFQMVEQLKAAIIQIDKPMITRWVEDLVISKTFTGLRFQKAILTKIAEIKKTAYKLSTPEEESKGIDGYIGETPVSVKSITYKSKEVFLSENIKVRMIYYDKKKDGIIVYYNL